MHSYLLLSLLFIPSSMYFIPAFELFIHSSFFVFSSSLLVFTVYINFPPNSLNIFITNALNSLSDKLVLFH